MELDRLDLWLTIPTMVLGLGYLVAIVLMLRTLRLRHTGVWTEMGRPSLILGNSLRNNASVLTFLFSEKHRSMGDERLSRYTNASRWLLVLAVVSFVLELGLFVLFVRGAT